MSNPARIKLARRIAFDFPYYRTKILGNGPLWQAPAGRGSQFTMAQAYQNAITGKGKRKIAIRAGKGLGKTFDLGEIALHFGVRFPGSLVVTTAPSTRQVRDLLWGEIESHYHRARVPIGGHLVTMNLEFGPKWMMTGFATDKPVNASGYHARRALVIVDEAQGVEDAILDELDGIVQGSECVLIYSGNPTRTRGRFFQAFQDPDFEHIVMDCLDHPNVIEGRDVFPGMVSKDWCDKRLRRWGKSSPLYRAYVRGLFPEGGTQYVISIDDIQWAKTHALPDDPSAPVEAGVDFADGGMDENVFFVRKGRRVLGYVWWSGTRAMATADKVAQLCNEWHVDILRPDPIGIGSGITDRLRVIAKDKTHALNFRAEIHPVHFGEGAINDRQFANRRAECWIQLGEMLADHEIDMTAIAGDCEELEAQLTSAEEDDVKGNGQRILKPKDETRGDDQESPSPDRADAMVMAFANLKPRKRLSRIITAG